MPHTQPVITLAISISRCSAACYLLPWWYIYMLMHAYMYICNTYVYTASVFHNNTTYKEKHCLNIAVTKALRCCSLVLSLNTAEAKSYELVFSSQVFLFWLKNKPNPKSKEIEANTAYITSLCEESQGFFLSFLFISCIVLGWGCIYLAFDRITVKSGKSKTTKIKATEVS